MKINTTITLDIDTFIEAKERIPNISAVINSFLKDYLQIARNTPKDNTEAIRNEIAKYKALAISMESELEKVQKVMEKKTSVVFTD